MKNIAIDVVLSYAVLPIVASIGNTKEAEKSLRFYRNVPAKAATEAPQTSSSSITPKPFEHELAKLKAMQLISQRLQTSGQPAVGIRDFMCRPFAIGCVLMWAHEFCGIFTMCSYASMIFARSGSSMSPTVSTMIVGATQFVGSYTSTMLVDRLGRKVHALLYIANIFVLFLLLSVEPRARGLAK